jgi:tRNA(fMet)-specific endonuclease VapC
MLLLDTNAVSAVMHRRPEALERLRAEEPWSVILCSPVAAEIQYGLARLAAGSRRRKLLEAEYRRLRKVVSWQDWTEEAATEYGRLKALLEQKGARIDDMDLVIASVALATGARIATCNRRHFSRIQGLDLDDWTIA